MHHRPQAYAGATVVGFYGEKPAALTGWLMALQDRILQEMPGFTSRKIDEVHVTVIGLEYAVRAVSAADVLNLARYLTGCFKDGIELQFGGYEPGKGTFTSRGQDLYTRSFSLAGGQCVLIGWPATSSDKSQDLRNSLATVRRGAERFGFRHRYHRVSDDRDPDCYMVVGDYDEEYARRYHAAPYATEAAIRNYLAVNPLSVSLRAEDLSVVRYQSPTLESASSSSLPVSHGLSFEAAAQIAGDLDNGR
jgi:hypothetical protein